MWSRARTKVQLSLPPGQQDNSNALPPGQSDRSKSRPMPRLPPPRPRRLNIDRCIRGLNKKNSVLKNFVFKWISKIEKPKSSKLHRYVHKVRKLYHARYKCNNKRDPKMINVNKIAIPKKAYLLSFFSRHYHKIMKLKCKARLYLSFSCNCVSRMTNYMNFKLSKDVEKNPGPLIIMK